jgi:hypothetical protein
VSAIVDIVSRYYKDDRMCQVSYAISLSDGRMIRLDIPSSHDLPESRAKEYARRQAEDYMTRLLIAEKNSGRFTCCSGLTERGAIGHIQNCPAVR